MFKYTPRGVSPKYAVMLYNSVQEALDELAGASYIHWMAQLLSPLEALLQGLLLRGLFVSGLFVRQIISMDYFYVADYFRAIDAQRLKVDKA